MHRFTSQSILVVGAKNIPEVISRNDAECTVLGQIKRWVSSGYLDPPVYFGRKPLDRSFSNNFNLQYGVEEIQKLHKYYIHTSNLKKMF